MQISLRGNKLSCREGNPLQIHVHEKSTNLGCIWPILSHCSISLLPENVRRPAVFWSFQGVYKYNFGVSGLRMG